MNIADGDLSTKLSSNNHCQNSIKQFLKKTQTITLTIMIITRMIRIKKQYYDRLFRDFN